MGWCLSVSLAFIVIIMRVHYHPPLPQHPHPPLAIYELITILTIYQLITILTIDKYIDMTVASVAIFLIDTTKDKPTIVIIN